MSSKKKNACVCITHWRSNILLVLLTEVLGRINGPKWRQALSFLLGRYFAFPNPVAPTLGSWVGLYELDGPTAWIGGS
jgi:hypothetical protein